MAYLTGLLSPGHSVVMPARMVKFLSRAEND